MSTWSVRLDLQDGSGWFDLMDYTVAGKRIVRVDEFQKTERLYRDTQPTIDTAQFRVTMDSVLAAAILTNTEPILCEIDKDGSPWFTGIARPVTRYRVGGVDGGDTIDFEIVDRGQRLKKEIAADISFVSYKICNPSNTSASIVHQFLIDAGYTLAEIGTLELIDVSIPYIQFPAGDVYFDVLSEFLFNHRRSFYHDREGKFQLYNWAPASITTIGTIVDSLVVSNLEIEIDDAQEDTVEVVYNSSETVSDVLLASVRFGNFGVPLMYLNEFDTSDDYFPAAGEVHTFRHDDTAGEDDKVLWVDNFSWRAFLRGWDLTGPGRTGTQHGIWPSVWIGSGDCSGVIAEVFNPSAEKTEFRLRATFANFIGDNRHIDLNYLEIRADVVYLRGEQRYRKALPSAKGVISEFKASWLYTEADAASLAAALLDRLDKSKTKFYFESEAVLYVGEYYTISNTATGISTTARIVEVTDRGETNPFVRRYVAEQCAELSVSGGSTTSANYGNVITRDDLYSGALRSTVGLSPTGNITQFVDSNQIDPAAEPYDGIDGLYQTHDKLGWWDGAAWKSYLASDGTFKFEGDGSNYMEWDGTKLSVYGDMFLSGDSIIRGTLDVGDTLTVEGDINVTGGGSIYGTGYSLSASALTMTAGSINIGSGTFVVDVAGNLTATSGTFAGSLVAATGTFSGDLSAAGGTFSGELSAATGTFAGTLSAAGGTFTGSLTAATGTFAGELSAATGSFSGTITAGGGSIGGWSIGATTLSSPNITLDDGNDRITVGAGVTLDGAAGEITATAGTIGGWTLGATTLSSGNITLDQGNDQITIGSTVTLDGATGEITASAGTIGGWQIGTLLKSGNDGTARVELDPTNNRVTVFDSANAKVAMGYLGGLPKYGVTPAENWTASDYGFWVRESNSMVIDGDIEYVSGNWLVESDASIVIDDGAVTPTVLLRFGSYSGAQGVFVNETETTDYRAKLTSSAFYVGDSDSFISFESGALSMKLDSFYVSTLLTNVKGTLQISQEGTPEELTDPLQITSTGGLATITSASNPLTIANNLDVTGTLTGADAEFNSIYASDHISVGIAGRAAGSNFLVDHRYGGPMSTGTWYTIATTTSGRATGRFTLIDETTSHHQSVTFYVSVHYWGTPTISIINASGYAIPLVFGDLRVGQVSSDAGCTLQVRAYYGGSVIRVVLESDWQNPGWDLVPFTTSDLTGSGATPTTWTTFDLTDGSGHSTSNLIGMGTNRAVRIEGDLLLGGKIIANDDLNTYTRFNASDSWQVVAGNGIRLTVDMAGVHVFNSLDVGADLTVGSFAGIPLDSWTSGGSTFLEITSNSGTNYRTGLRIVEDVGVNVWRLQATTNNDFELMEENSDRVYIDARQGAGVRFYWDSPGGSVVRLETVEYGIEVSGNAYVSGSVYEGGNKILDSGSNANGDYIKYADGTMICWHTFTTSSTTHTWTYPVAFAATPAVTTGLHGSNSNYLYAVTTSSGNPPDSTSGGTFYKKYYVGGSAAIADAASEDLHVQAIGRWE